MAYCTTAEVRAVDDKFINVTDLTDIKIQGRVTESEKIIKVDLSNLITPSDLDTLMSGADPSIAVNLMAIYKTSELILVALYGANRKVDEVTDIKYYELKYKDLLKKIIDGDINLYNNTDGSNTVKAYPALTGNNMKIYPNKGVTGFINDDANSDVNTDGKLE